MVKIVIDQKKRHGKPTIEGTRITVDEVLCMLEAGMTYQDIQKEYGLTKEQIVAAIKHASSYVRGEEVYSVPA